jgi:hypothetical protein
MKKIIFKYMVRIEDRFWKFAIKFAGKDFSKWLDELNDEVIRELSNERNI